MMEIESERMVVEIDREPERMLDVIFYRDVVLEITLGGKHIPREVYELRFTLFLEAANAHFNSQYEVLEPFPPCFFETPNRKYDELRLCISSIPNLSTMNELTSLPPLTWELLFWIFTNPLNIKEKKKSAISDFKTDELREETKLLSIPYPSDHCKRFRIIHPIEINSTKLFRQHKARHGSFFAYHGSPGYNFHSIIHRGLRCSLNITSAYGKGTYLSSDLNTAKSYSQKYYSRTSTHNSANLQNPGGIRYCIAIVEVIKDPSIKVVNFNGVGNRGDHFEEPNFDDTSSNQLRYYVVNSDELLQLKHLLVFY